MKDSNIAFIGGGNMGRSLIGGLVADGCDPQRLWVADPSTDTLQKHRDHFGVHITISNGEAIEQADVVVLAVKPQIAKDVMLDCAAALRRRGPLLISVAAGIREADLRRWAGAEVAIVRTMPNTPALVRAGATALYANAYVTADQKDLAESILRAVGVTLWLDNEALMDAVTALSGSGPAYFFLVMEALENAGRRLGLDQDTARLLTLQTAYGAAKMALESTEGVADLRRRVTSPGGTTEQGIKVLQDGDVQALFDRALAAARQRSEELAKMFGEA